MGMLTPTSTQVRPPNTKSISGMTAVYNVYLRTLRFYEGRGLPSPHRVGVARFYSPKDEARLQLIQTGKRLGFSLSEIEGIISCCVGANDESIFSCQDSVHVLSSNEIREQIVTLQKERARVNGALEELCEVQRRLAAP